MVSSICATGIQYEPPDNPRCSLMAIAEVVDIHSSPNEETTSSIFGSEVERGYPLARTTPSSCLLQTLVPSSMATLAASYGADESSRVSLSSFGHHLALVVNDVGVERVVRPREGDEIALQAVQESRRSGGVVFARDKEVRLRDGDLWEKEVSIARIGAIREKVEMLTLFAVSLHLAESQPEGLRYRLRYSDSDARTARCPPFEMVQIFSVRALS